MTLVRTPNVSRRTALGTIASAGGVAIGAGALLASGPEPASASLSVTDSLSVADTTHRSESGAVSRLWLTLSGSIYWESVDVLPDNYQIDLELATTEQDAQNGNYDKIGRTEGSILTYSGQAPFSLLGEATAHVNLDAADVAAPEASSSTTTDLLARVVGKIQQGDDTLIEATATDSATLVVENTSVAIESAVEASGGVQVQANESDPTPTVA